MSGAGDDDASGTRAVDDTVGQAGADRARSGGHGHWLMVACCIPMLVIAIVLVASGASIGTLAIAVACTAMMAAMMVGMTRGS